MNEVEQLIEEFLKREHSLFEIYHFAGIEVFTGRAGRRVYKIEKGYEKESWSEARYRLQDGEWRKL